MSPPPPPPSQNPLAAVEEECEYAACKTMLDVLKSSAGMSSFTKGSATRKPSKSAPSVSTPADEAAWRKAHCPLDINALGDATWGMLHSTAAYYPENPTPQEQSLAAGLIHGIAGLYPCTHCRKDFQACVKEAPPRVENRRAFAVWVCEQHNAVNEKLGKPLFPCDIAMLDKRWRKGEARCWGEGEGGGGGGGGGATTKEANSKQQPPASSVSSSSSRKKDKIYVIEPGEGKKKAAP